MVSGTLQGHLPEYGDDACGAATVSRQLPRTAKLVDALGPLTRTGVQFSPSPMAKYLNYRYLAFFLLNVIANMIAIKNRIFSLLLGFKFLKEGGNVKAVDGLPVRVKPYKVSSAVAQVL